MIRGVEVWRWEFALGVSRMMGGLGMAEVLQQGDGEWKRVRRKGLLSDEMALHH